MILYGGLLNSHSVLNPANATPFTLTGALRIRAAIAVVQADTAFPIYGALRTQRLPPTYFTIYGAHNKRLILPVMQEFYGAVRNQTVLSFQIENLTLSTIGIKRTYNTPKLTYDISPYTMADIYKVIGAAYYTVTGSILTVTTLPTGPIEIIPNSRAVLWANEVAQVVLGNTAPTKYAFSNINITGDVQFSTSNVGPWTNSITPNIGDTFYIKAPDMAVDGVDFTKELYITAKVTPC